MVSFFSRERRRLSQLSLPPFLLLSRAPFPCCFPRPDQLDISHRLCSLFAPR